MIAGSHDKCVAMARATRATIHMDRSRAMEPPGRTQAAPAPPPPPHLRQLITTTSTVPPDSCSHQPCGSCHSCTVSSACHTGREATGLLHRLHRQGLIAKRCCPARTLTPGQVHNGPRQSVHNSTATLCAITSYVLHSSATPTRQPLTSHTWSGSPSGLEE